jgi:hypothetical protein
MLPLSLSVSVAKKKKAQPPGHAYSEIKISFLSGSYRRKKVILSKAKNPRIRPESIFHKIDETR